MIPAPRPPAEEELPPGGEAVVAALAAAELPTLDDEASQRIRDQVVRAAGERTQ